MYEQVIAVHIVDDELRAVKTYQHPCLDIGEIKFKVTTGVRFYFGNDHIWEVVDGKEVKPPLKVLKAMPRF